MDDDRRVLELGSPRLSSVSSRHETKYRREAHAVEWCCEWHSRRTNTKFEVLSRPARTDHLDGLIQSRHATRWVEVVSITLGNEWDRYSEDIGDGKNVGLPSNVVVNSDLTFSKTFVDRIAGKFYKENYAKSVAKYGFGLLVATVFYPFFTARTLSEIKRVVASKRLSFNGSYFSDGLALIHPYHANGFTINLRSVIPRNPHILTTAGLKSISCDS
jgi:hypothetical protein